MANSVQMAFSENPLRVKPPPNWLTPIESVVLKKIRFCVSLSPSRSSSMKDILAFTTLLARKLILLKWKSSSTPNSWPAQRLCFMFKTVLVADIEAVMFPVYWTGFSHRLKTKSDHR